LKNIGGPEKGRLLEKKSRDFLLAACVFGDSFGSFADGVLGQLSWQQKTNSGLEGHRYFSKSI
jgi:hypothetical protein